MSLVAAAFILGSAIGPHSFAIADIQKRDRSSGQCQVTAIADNGPLIAEVTWASCSEIDVRVMSAAELEKSGQLAHLGWLRDLLLRTPNQVILTAWGPNAATAYSRGSKDSSETFEIALAD
jgi:hypothetical protein